jgi:hypothetical protein
MTAKDKKSAGFLIYVQDILSWLAGFSVKILLNLAKTHADVLPAPTWQKASGWRNAPAKDVQVSSI